MFFGTAQLYRWNIGLFLGNIDVKEVLLDHDVKPEFLGRLCACSLVNVFAILLDNETSVDEYESFTNVIIF